MEAELAKKIVDGLRDAGIGAYLLNVQQNNFNKFIAPSMS